jgi:adenine phosphoribosyltransferase
MNLEEKVRAIPDFPKAGILFRDITTLLNDSEAFAETMEILYEKYVAKGVEAVAAIESRGFIFGAPLALRLGCPFVLIRKPGKLPAETVSAEYSLEYGTDKIEMHKDALGKGQKVLLIDDLLATGGTMAAACRLVESVGAEVAGVAFVIELNGLKGRDNLKEYDVFALLHF